MPISEFTIVIGVDGGHIGQLRLSLPTWHKCKPSLLNSRLVVFYDADQVPWTEVASCCRPHPSTSYYPWPPPNVEYENDVSSRFGSSQRYKMLSGFVHVPPLVVKTPYWLKIDLDTIATGMDDWIEESWFDNDPAIVSHPWGYTKPSDQMMKLDYWAQSSNSLQDLYRFKPLNLVPLPGSSVVRHKRIISWVGFFNTEFTRLCSDFASKTCGVGKLPVPSQDGYMWYVAKRLGLLIRRENMKSRGWIHCSSESSILKTIQDRAEKVHA